MYFKVELMQVSYLFFLILFYKVMTYLPVFTHNQKAQMFAHKSFLYYQDK